MANQAPGLSSTTAGPAVVGNLVIVGQQVSDNQRQDAPSGVVRAFDVITGDFTWAWDAKRSDRTQEPLAPGEIWPQGTPNVWNVISADENLNLVYLATGNPANDHYGGNRDPEDDEYTAAIVAVNASTGEAQWHFRTVDHDLWDYDIGAQPILLDIVLDGEMRRAVLAATKTGSLFVLDAVTGELLWAQPLGTGYDIGPLGIPTRLKLTIGTPNVGGPVTTGTGLTFIAAAQDNFLRAFNTTTGELLWEGCLPYSAQSGPITYMHNGRQYIAVAAGGHARLETDVGDSIIVFVLAQ